MKILIILFLLITPVLAEEPVRPNYSPWQKPNDGCWRPTRWSFNNNTPEQQKELDSYYNGEKICVNGLMINKKS